MRGDVCGGHCLVPTQRTNGCTDTDHLESLDSGDINHPAKGPAPPGCILYSCFFWHCTQERLTGAAVVGDEACALLFLCGAAAKGIFCNGIEVSLAAAH